MCSLSKGRARGRQGLSSWLPLGKLSISPWAPAPRDRTPGSPAGVRLPPPPPLIWWPVCSAASGCPWPPSVFSTYFPFLQQSLLILAPFLSVFSFPSFPSHKPPLSPFPHIQMKALHWVLEATGQARGNSLSFVGSCPSPLSAFPPLPAPPGPSSFP